MRTSNVLFLCTGNSARSVMAEALLNARGQGRFQAYSAGSHPKGEVHPLTLATLDRAGLSTRGLRSKSWKEFSGPEAPRLDFVFTVCGNAANEPCPYWSGHPVTAHWGVDDPASVDGAQGEKERAFQRAFMALDARVQRFVALPLATLEAPALLEKLGEIGRGG